MDECIFCKIIKGELPNHTIYEDDSFLSFLSIYPRSSGHTLLIPKKHYRWTYDVPEFGEYWEKAREIALVVKKATEAKWLQFVTFGEIPHAHIHIIPRYEESPVGSEIALKDIEGNPYELAELAKKIRAGF